jgi:hypothetical protein
MDLFTHPDVGVFVPVLTMEGKLDSSTKPQSELVDALNGCLWQISGDSISELPPITGKGRNLGKIVTETPEEAKEKSLGVPGQTINTGQTATRSLKRKRTQTDPVPASQPPVVLEAGNKGFLQKTHSMPIISSVNGATGSLHSASTTANTQLTGFRKQRDLGLVVTNSDSALGTIHPATSIPESVPAKVM